METKPDIQDGPFAAPVTPTPAPPRAATMPGPPRTRALQAIGLGLLPAFGLFTIGIVGWLLSPRLDGMSELIPTLIMGALSGGAIAGFVIAIRALRAASSADDVFGMILGGFAVLVSFLGAGFGILMTLMATNGFSRGRQIRRLGKTLLPPVDQGSRWSEADAASSVAVEDEARGKLAEAWRENGRTEHASVAAFAGVSLDLICLGAPPELVRAAHQDALDEVRHTELCFALAQEIDGKSTGPMAFPGARRALTATASRSLSLARLAVDSLVEGAMNEGVSARVVAALAKEVEVPRIRAVLMEIARDEARHAANGFRVLAWCLEAGGPFVRGAVSGALSRIPITMAASLTPDAADGGWERYGITGRERELAAYHEVRARVVRRTEALLAA
ncbi:MAG: ferritin-like domain-containing protein [Myxococcota bacterium]